MSTKETTVKEDVAEEQVQVQVSARDGEQQMNQLAEEMNAKFARLVRSLKSPRDLKVSAEWLGKGRELPVTSPNGFGTERHRFEVEMAYVQDEFTRGPVYLRPKLIDRMSQIIANVINKLKEQRETTEEAQAAT